MSGPVQMINGFEARWLKCTFFALEKSLDKFYRLFGSFSCLAEKKEMKSLIIFLGHWNGTRHTHTRTHGWTEETKLVFSSFLFKFSISFPRQLCKKDKLVLVQFSFEKERKRIAKKENLEQVNMQARRAGRGGSQLIFFAHVMRDGMMLSTHAQRGWQKYRI